MAKIKNINVKVTYSVGLGGLTAPKKVLEQLNEIADNGDEIDFATFKYPEARDWIQENIKERDCYEASFEIVDLD
jgi:hypothetical protein